MATKKTKTLIPVAKVQKHLEDFRAHYQTDVEGVFIVEDNDSLEHFFDVNLMDTFGPSFESRNILRDDEGTSRKFVVKGLTLLLQGKRQDQFGILFDFDSRTIVGQTAKGFREAYPTYMKGYYILETTEEICAGRHAVSVPKYTLMSVEGKAASASYHVMKNLKYPGHFMVGVRNESEKVCRWGVPTVPKFLNWNFDLEIKQIGDSRIELTEIPGVYLCGDMRSKIYGVVDHRENPQRWIFPIADRIKGGTIEFDGKDWYQMMPQPDKKVIVRK
jgi:hypothetical protein